MKTIVVALTVLALVITFTSAPQFTLAQEKPADQPAVAQNAPKETAEAKKQPDFLKDLDKALKQGCGAFYLYMGWEKFEPPSLVCVDGT
jgi:hypothetical protein